VIREIQEITQKMFALNSSVHESMLSSEDIHIIKNAITAIEHIKKEINCLLQAALIISIAQRKEHVEVLVKIHQLFSQLAIAITEIDTLSIKFVRNYRKKYLAIEKVQHD
jgi:hypothetical protein